MHVRSSSAAQAVAAAAMVAAATLLVGCSPTAPTAPTASDATPTPTGTSAPPSPSASATPTPTASPTPTSSETAGQLFETQNGTMRLRLPEGWTANDLSRVSTDHRNGQVWWENMIAFTSPSGTELDYYDGYGGNVGFIRTDFTIVEELPTEIASDVAAMSWWVHDYDQYFVYAGMATHSGEGTEPIPEFVMPGVERNHHFTVVLHEESDPSVASQAEAEALLSSAEIVEALELIATVELTGVDPSSMPPGVEP
jgi:hypothetical protein